VRARETASGCKDGDVKGVGCSTCYCLPDGTYKCDDSGCKPPEPVCKPGESMALDACSKCTCDDTGQWSCAKLDNCQPPPPPPVCKPGEKFPIDCNTCSCDALGQWSCTKEICPPAPEPLHYDCARNKADCDKSPTIAVDPASGLCCYYDFSCEVPAGFKVVPSADVCPIVTTTPGK
jgi:hypothetical protein